MRATDVVKLPHKRNRRLAYGAIFTGIVIVVLLLLALNRGPISRGFAPEGNGTGLRALCPWCEEGEPITPTDVLGIVLIALVVLALPAGHLALLIMLASRISRPPKFTDIEPVARCPAATIRLSDSGVTALTAANRLNPQFPTSRIRQVDHA